MISFSGSVEIFFEQRCVDDVVRCFRCCVKETSLFSPSEKFWLKIPASSRVELRILPEYQSAPPNSSLKVLSLVT